MFRVTAFRMGSILLATAPILSCSIASNDASGDRAEQLHQRAIVIDAHAHPKPGAEESLSLGQKTDASDVDLLTMEEGGLDAVFFSAPLLGPASDPPDTPEKILGDLRSIADEVRRNEDLAEMAWSPADIRRIHDLGKRAVLLGLESPTPLSGDLGMLERYFDAGLRMLTMSDEMMEGTEPAPDAPIGLTPHEFMTGIVEEMNRLGMIIDLSHASDGLQMEIIRTSDKPVIASHSNTRALNDIPRQMPDSVIRALAEKGGVICVTFFPGHVSSDFPDRPATIEDLVDHIDHIVQLVGTDHVGIGSDFLGSDTNTVGLESAAGLPAITGELLERGYSGTEIEKILGGNLLRVFETVHEAEGTSAR